MSDLLCETDGRSFRGEHTDGDISAVIPYAEIYSAEVLNFSLFATTDTGQRQKIKAPLLLRQIDIRTSAEFGERVQSLRKRMTDNEAVRFCARRLLMNPASTFEGRAAAVCAIGYRIVERRDPEDSDIEFLRAEAQHTLAMVKRGVRTARWITSITTMLTYLAVLLREAEKAEDLLIETLSYRPFLPQLSLLHTNFSRSNLLLSLIRASRSDIVGARAALDDIEYVFQIGVKASWIDDPIKGRNQFSEIIAVLKVARLAHRLKDQMERAYAENAMADFSSSVEMSAISPIIKSLQEDGHWQSVLDSNINSREAASTRRRLAKNLQDGPAVARPDPYERRPQQNDNRQALLARYEELSAASENLLSQASIAVTNNDIGRVDELIDLMDDIFDIAENHHFKNAGSIWKIFVNLSQARCLIACLLAKVDLERAYSLLSAQAYWSKAVLTSLPIEHDQDHHHAEIFVFSALISYLIAFRYLKPEARHLDDAGIFDDLTRSFDRIYKNPALREVALGNVGCH